MVNATRDRGEPAPASTPTAEERVFEILEKLPSQAPVNARALLERHRELSGDRTAIVALAYEEYCRRTNAGELVSLSEFAVKFPTCESLLREQLDFEQDVRARPDVVERAYGSIWPDAGDEFLGFELLEQIGRGMFSRVYLASETGVGDRAVVVKLCFRGVAEAHMLGRLSHPNVVPVFSVRNDDETSLSAICMPYLSRATLGHVLDAVFASGTAPRRGRAILDAVGRTNSGGKPPRPPGPPQGAQSPLEQASYAEAVAHIGVQIAEALALTHRQKVWHCDIKPSNVLMTSEGQAMLLDFNLACSEGSGSVRGGTLPYMAPEQLRRGIGNGPGHDVRLDGRTDLFSLGVMLYQLLSGRLPFGPVPTGLTRKQDMQQLLERQQRGPAPLCKANRQVWPDLARVVEQCLAFDPADRPQSAGELAAALRRELSARVRPARLVRRRKRLALAACGIALLAGLAFLGPPPRESASRAASVPTSRPDAQAGFVGDAGLGAVAHAARRRYVLERGVEGLQSGRYEVAIAHFDRLLGENPEDVDALFARGRARTLAGRIDGAVADLQAASRLTGDGRVSAALGYALCLREPADDPDTLRLARHHFQRALARGFGGAAVQNDLGYCQLRLHELPDAVRSLEAALAADGTLVAALHNLATVEFHAACLEKRGPNLEAIERAISTAPGSAELWREAARLHALAARHGRPVRAETDEHVRRSLAAARQAVELGIDPSRLNEATALLPVELKTKRFDRMSGAAMFSAFDERSARLVDPLAQAAEPVTLHGR